METIKRISEMDPRDVRVVERVFGQRLDVGADVELVLRVGPEPARPPAAETGVPAWCNVLEGLSDEDLANFQATLETPTRLGRCPD